MNCIFCEIGKGNIPSKTIYENDLIKAFLDVNPITKGHVLVIPKNHYVELSEMPDSEIIALNNAIKEIYPKMEKALGCSGFNICVNYGTCQEVKHLHYHIIPKYDGGKAPLISNYTNEKIDNDEVFNVLIKHFN